MFCELNAFLEWWLTGRQLRPPKEYILNQEGSITGCVLYRDGQYQVQLFIVQPNCIIEPHIHPNVDSFEVYLSGDIEFSVGGITIDQTAMESQRVLRVLPDEFHGGKFGERGGVFLSVQKWLDGYEPTSVGYNWVDKTGNTQGKASKIGEHQIN